MIISPVFDKESNKPLYIQLYEYIKTEITSGLLKPKFMDSKSPLLTPPFLVVKQCNRSSYSSKIGKVKYTKSSILFILYIIIPLLISSLWNSYTMKNNKISALGFGHE